MEKPILVVELFQDTIPMLRQVLIGFDLLGGMRFEDGKRLAEMLNEHVLGLFVRASESSERERCCQPCASS